MTMSIKIIIAHFNRWTASKGNYQNYTLNFDKVYNQINENKIKSHTRDRRNNYTTFWFKTKAIHAKHATEGGLDNISLFLFRKPWFQKPIALENILLRTRS
jgi:hypothetical protein